MIFRVLNFVINLQKQAYLDFFFTGIFRKRMTAEESLSHPWIQPESEEQEEERRDAQTNMDNFKSYQARRRWKVSVSLWECKIDQYGTIDQLVEAFHLSPKLGRIAS